MLNVRTEYSFRKVYGPIDKVAQAVQVAGYPAACISDFNNTYGHVQWRKACGKVGIKPVYGVTLAVVEDASERTVQPINWMGLVALDNAGLCEMYRLVGKAWEQFYYIPRVSYSQINDLGDGIAVLSGINCQWALIERDVYAQLSPDNINPVPSFLQKVSALDNYYPAVDDREVYELLIGSNAEEKTTPQHIISDAEWSLQFKDETALANTRTILDTEEVKLNQAPMIKAKGKSLKRLCEEGAKKRGLDITQKEYKARLERELMLIKKKNYTDYFRVVADLVQYAKKHMLVGPSRGSSAGSLVCYLLFITEVDPLEFGLLFERFIDLNREDLPDIDIDFPDDKREMVVEYLQKKYGQENVSHIGTVSRYKPKSAIDEFSKQLGIPAWEVKDVKDSIIERSSGDARSAQCIKDTFDTTEVGKEFIEKHPQMALVEHIEEHARHSGVHAAGILVCNDPIADFAGVNNRDHTAMVDKKDAEALNLLKIDVLGLRTLTILADVCDQIGKPYEWLYGLPLDDEGAFGVFNSMRLAGIFQFEGYALQSLTRQMKVEEFNDIVAITSLARPGPLHCGGATMFVERRTGKTDIEYLHDHDSVVGNTEETYGTIIYQEQVMQIGREFGGLSWEDVSNLRKAMSKSLGEEFFNKYKARFLKGTRKKGVDDDEATSVWENMCTFGSWGFNKSHAVSYGLISYWTAYLKAHHPLEFAVATLNNIRNEEQGIKFLRDIVKNEGYEYTPVDPDKSMAGWSIDDGKLLGGLLNIKGIGDKMAADILARREDGRDLTKGQAKKLAEPETKYDELFPTEKQFGDYYINPSKYDIRSAPVVHIEDIQDNGTYIFIGRLVDKNLRDLNEYGSVVKRGGKIIKHNNLFLNMTVEDDTDSIICTVDRYKYKQLGKPIVEKGVVGKDWYLIKGRIRDDWRKVYITQLRRLT